MVFSASEGRGSSLGVQLPGDQIQPAQAGDDGSDEDDDEGKQQPLDLRTGDFGIKELLHGGDESGVVWAADSNFNDVFLRLIIFNICLTTCGRFGSR